MWIRSHSRHREFSLIEVRRFSPVGSRSDGRFRAGRGRRCRRAGAEAEAVKEDTDRVEQVQGGAAGGTAHRQRWVQGRGWQGSGCAGEPHHDPSAAVPVPTVRPVEGGMRSPRDGPRPPASGLAGRPSCVPTLPHARRRFSSDPAIRRRPPDQGRGTAPLIARAMGRCRPRRGAVRGFPHPGAGENRPSVIRGRPLERHDLGVRSRRAGWRAHTPLGSRAASSASSLPEALPVAVELPLLAVGSGREAG
jgi:hypothetical protein